MEIKITTSQKEMLEIALEAYVAKMFDIAEAKDMNNKPDEREYFEAEAVKYFELLRDIRVLGK